MKSAERDRDARSLALQALLNGGTQAALDRVLKGGAGPKNLHRIDDRERALATELTYGAVKMRRALVWSLQHHLRKPFDTLAGPLQNVLLLGAYQLLYLKKIPAHSAVDESVRLARRYGHAGTAALANAVLRKLTAEPLRPPLPSDPSQVKEFADFASLPDWLAEHWIQRFGFANSLRIAEGVNAPARRAVRVNTTQVSVHDLRAELAAKGASVRESRYGIPDCVVLGAHAAPAGPAVAPALRRGLLTVQSEESQLAVHLFDPKPGESIVDVCAGRGVKAGAIGQRIHAVPTPLYALDDDAAKLRLLASEFQRLGLRAPQLICCDARRPLPSAVPNNTTAVLVDAPCSGIGTIGRRAEMRWSKQASDADRLAAVQLAILKQSARIVRNGGRLLYAVCSTTPQENEKVVAAFLAATPAWHSAPLSLHAPENAVFKVGDYAVTVPGIDGADGFFYALLVRASAGSRQARTASSV